MGIFFALRRSCGSVRSILGGIGTFEKVVKSCIYMRGANIRRVEADRMPPGQQATGLLCNDNAVTTTHCHWQTTRLSPLLPSLTATEIRSMSTFSNQETSGFADFQTASGPGPNIPMADAQGLALLAGLVGFIRPFIDVSHTAATGVKDSDQTQEDFGDSIRSFTTIRVLMQRFRFKGGAHM
ncbi:hypothetical protein HYPSUDRAFT_723312 [Hypholoma sublateritium FD-334 SS-4]|uniref:Uncharacterized protein n=1 Tax=Hypholoma sublateritium (strain FD-334 SS-4) TaxID=945553 RepID=A0A0D2NYD4_HYPSF|nr:hypothetical protein HYPSUDRAFT_723312 [Hypholoma sublateritium FD-334 SS-4]